MQVEDLVSVSSYAALVDKSRERIYQLINEGDERIHVTKIDGVVFIDKKLSASSI